MRSLPPNSICLLLSTYNRGTRWGNVTPGKACRHIRRFRALAEGIATALAPSTAAGLPIVLLIDGDVGMTLGRLLADMTVPGTDVIAIDALSLGAFDYVDIGAVLPI
jgi:ethanolamine utilization protein EutA (predicted chaperonin)